MNRLPRELRFVPGTAGAADLRDRFLFLISPSASPAPRDWEQLWPAQTGLCVRVLLAVLRGLPGSPSARNAPDKRATFYFPAHWPKRTSRCHALLNRPPGVTTQRRFWAKAPNRPRGRRRRGMVSPDHSNTGGRLPSCGSAWAGSRCVQWRAARRAESRRWGRHRVLPTTTFSPV